MQEFEKLINELLAENRIEKAVATSPVDKKSIVKKFEIKPFLKEGSVNFQITFYEEKKNFHKNIEKTAAADEITKAFCGFKQMVVVSDEYDYQILNNGAGKIKIIKKKNAGKKRDSGVRS